MPDTNWDPGVSLLKELRAMSMPALQRLYVKWWDTFSLCERHHLTH